MFVEERYSLPFEVKQSLSERPVSWGFGPLSQAVYYRSYSRQTPFGDQERWADTVTRVVEGVMSVRKDWLTRVVGRRWNEDSAHRTAAELADYIFSMKLLPPGRGLFAMGTDYIYERGSHALNNCASIDVRGSLSYAAEWLMDSLMCGVGVGFTTYMARLSFKGSPSSDRVEVYRVPDSREGWVESVRRLIASYEDASNTIEFDYSQIRPKGTPLKGFGGTSSGYKPLQEAHDRVRTYLEMRVRGETSDTRVIADVMNAIGACVVAGNIRRSAEIALGSVDDRDFLNLKNYYMNPERSEIGWMSNNSVALRTRDDFDKMPMIAERVADNGEPGLINFMNIQKYGRMGERSHDAATGINPCAEIPLESGELCNLVEVFPTRCRDTQEVFKAMELATFYASTVSLLRSHSSMTNEVVARNRRIGVSISGIADWLDQTSVSHVFGVLNRGYEHVVRPVNRRLARGAGVPESIRVTTVKPSGSISLLAGVSSGMHHPIHSHVIRRVRMGDDSLVAEILADAGIPHEPDVASSNTTVFEFPLQYGAGKTRSVDEVSIFEQAAIVAMLQKSWADNAVSNTLSIRPDEHGQVERVLALFAPQVKSFSMMPISTTAYAQSPIERITPEQYQDRQAQLSPVNWGKLTGLDGTDSKFCTTDACEVL